MHVRFENCTHSLEITSYGNSVFPYHEGLLLKEIISSWRKQIHSFKRSPHFEKGRSSLSPIGKSHKPAYEILLLIKLLIAKGSAERIVRVFAAHIHNV